MNHSISESITELADIALAGVIERRAKLSRTSSPVAQSRSPTERRSPDRDQEQVLAGSTSAWSRSPITKVARTALQQSLLFPVTRFFGHPKVRGGHWLDGLAGPVIFAANHSSHADTAVILYALPESWRKQTVVAAATDYFYASTLVGDAVALLMNTFPFSRTQAAIEVLNESLGLLRDGWNLLVYPEGTRAPEGRMGEFKRGVGFLAIEGRVPVVPIHLEGSSEVLPKGTWMPRPLVPIEVTFGRPLIAARNERARQFTERLQLEVMEIGQRRHSALPESWIERWRGGLRGDGK